MAQMNSYLSKNWFLTTKQSLYILTLSYFLVVILIVFVHTAEAQDDDFSEDTMNKIQQKINEKVDAMIKEIEGVRDGTRPPGKAGEMMDEVQEIADLIDQIIESTESEYAADRIITLGKLVQKLGEVAGGQDDQYGPLGEFITGMGEATEGMGDSLEKIEEGRKELRESVDRGWLSPVEHAEEEKAKKEAARARYLAAIREATEKHEESIESKRKAELHPECPEKCTEKYKLWENALDGRLKKRRERNKAVENHEKAKENGRGAEGIRIICEQALAKAKRDGAELNIMEAENTLRAFSEEKVKKNLENTKNSLNDAQAAVDVAKKAEEAAWSAYRECVKKCKKSRFTARMYNVDDIATMYINGQSLFKAKWGQLGVEGNWQSFGDKQGDSSDIDITSHLVSGINQLRFTVWNHQVCCYVSISIKVKKDGLIVFSDSFRSNDSTAGIKYDRTVSVLVK